MVYQALMPNASESWHDVSFKMALGLIIYDGLIYHVRYFNANFNSYF